MNKEIKRIIIDEGLFTTSDYPFLVKPSFSTFGCIIEISNEESAISSSPDDSIRELLGFNKTTMYEKNKLSPNPVDIISFDNIFIETNTAQGMIFKQKRTGIINNFTMTVNPGYIYVERFAGGVAWYMIHTNDFISSINFEIKNENNEIVSFNGQSVTFRLSIKEV